MKKWIVGQRVWAEFEPELGLGLVLRAEGQRVEVLFSQAEVTRQYVAQRAPLRRLVLHAGQRVHAKSGTAFTIASVSEEEGIFVYEGEGQKVFEYELASIVEDRNAVDQFLMGQWTEPEAFDLRGRAWRLKSHSLEPDLRGLVGARVRLLPHQLYLAHEISLREFPRVLLADEVGLGKTIEAGFIFSSLKALGRASRVLVLTPDALKHQWLAEMYRCFNEMFSVVDEERSEQEEASQEASAFKMNQRVICSFDFLLENPQRLEEAMEETWDLLIVDEAHHLQWSEDDPDEKWEVTRLLASRSRGLLLLTATPEQRGLATLFGLLHLVDPERFSEFAAFEKQMSGIRKAGDLARAVHSEDRAADTVKKLEKFAGADADLKSAVKDFSSGESPQALLRKLIDRHGMGRVLMRNRRGRLQGFPERSFLPTKLKAPESWLAYLKEVGADEDADPKTLLQIAAGRGRSLKSAAGNEVFTARCKWLLETIAACGTEKVLLICATPKRVAELEEWLRANSGIRLATFHENMEIVERDRQAAWFAQPDGAQILLCSEIGGEGRNFQFAHDLVLFDLPTHPDLLEQRIGRLDRIGQKQAIKIHVPYVEDTPEEVLVRWYAEGLGSFSQSWNGGAAVVEAVQQELFDTIQTFLPGPKAYAKRQEKLAALIETTKKEVARVQEKQRESQDLLVDLNSFDETKGNELRDRIKQVDADPELREFLEAVFDYFGVETEDIDDHGTLKVSAHSMSFVEHFPGLGSQGERMVTFERDHALSREELAFLSWDHPLAHGALSLVLEGAEGKASAALWKHSKQPDAVVFEFLYVLQVTAPGYLELDRDLPTTHWRVAVTLDGQLTKLPPTFENAKLSVLAPAALGAALGGLRKTVPGLAEKAVHSIEKEAKAKVDAAKASLRKRLEEEHARRKALARVNPLISKEEIQRPLEKIELGLAALSEAIPRLDAIRMILMK